MFCQGELVLIYMLLHGPNFSLMFSHHLFLYAGGQVLNVYTHINDKKKLKLSDLRDELQNESVALKRRSFDIYQKDKVR